MIILGRQKLNYFKGYLTPGHLLDQRQPFVFFHIELLVHFPDLLLSWGAEDLDDLLELIDLGIAHEGRDSFEHLDDHAAS